MDRVLKQILIIVCLIAILVLPYFVFAADSMKDIFTKAGQYGGYGDVTETSAAELAGTAVKAFLSLLGIIFIILILYAGFTWMTAQGDEEKINKAKGMIKTAIIGLVIVLASYAIYGFVFYRLLLGE